MMAALLAKELRSLRPMVWSIVALYIFSLTYVFATELPDAQHFTATLWLQESRSGVFVVLAVFCLLTGAGILTQESEHGTLRFLDGLPLSRTRLFIAKTLAALLVVAWVPALGLLSDVLLGWLSRSSVDPPIPWRFALATNALQMLAAAYLLALAMLVSFVRGWFALVMGLLFWTWLLLDQTDAPWLIYVDPHDLIVPALDGDEVGIRWNQVGVQAALTIVLLVCAWRAFLRMDDGAPVVEYHGLARLMQTGARLLKMLAPLVWIGAVVYMADSIQTDDEAPAGLVGETAFARHETSRFEFLLRSSQLEEAEPLFAEADALYDEVAALLGVTAPAGRVVVDLASPVISHAAGQTNWTKIRMPLMPHHELSDRCRILAHETAHVFLEQLGDGRLISHYSSIRSLHEGVASYVELALASDDEEQQQQHRRAVAGAWSRGAVPFELLIDDEALARQRDPNLVYPLGAELARALVGIHGKDAPRRLVQSITRQKAPPGLEGAELWRDAMQAAGFSYEQLVGNYESACTSIAAEEKEFVATLPRLSATVTTEGDGIVLHPQFSGAPPGEIVCLVDTGEVLNSPTRRVERRADGTFLTKSRSASNAGVRYLLGWSTSETDLPIFEPWATANR